MTDDWDLNDFEIVEIDDVSTWGLPTYARHFEPSSALPLGNVSDWRRLRGRRPKPGAKPVAQFGYGGPIFRNLFALADTEEIPIISAEEAASQGLKTAKEWNRQGLKIRGGAHPLARIPNKRKKGGAEMVYPRDSTVRFRDPDAYELTSADLAAMATAK